MRDVPIYDNIRRILRDGPTDVSSIAEALGAHKDTVRRALRLLRDRGEVDIAFDDQARWRVSLAEAVEEAEEVKEAEEVTTPASPEGLSLAELHRQAAELLETIERLRGAYAMLQAQIAERGG
jgi:DNA-binding transcriptional regulator LsrR (DeoR family)